MSGNSSKNSVSPQKGFFKRMLSQDVSRGAKHSEVRQRHPEFAVSSDTAVTPGRMVKPQETVISPAVKQLNKEGYAVFNTPEGQDIYVTIQPDSAFFEEEKPAMVRMAGDRFVGSGRQAVPAEAPVMQVQEPEYEVMIFDQPADIFSNASRREEYEEIDFNEIIIKSNDSFEEEFEQAPLFFRPSSEEAYEPIIEETFMMDAAPEYAETSTDAVEEVSEASYGGYMEIQEQDEEISVEEIPLTEAPAGLYLDGNRPNDVALTDDEESDEPSSFVEVSMEAETAVTSEAAVPAAEILLLPSPSEERAIYQEEPAAEFVIEEASETVTETPLIIEVADPVADIMKLTIPGLRMNEELMLEFTQDWEMKIPEDGLESYDCRFALRTEERVS
ncbi:MAG: hypothetical protein LBR42_03480 [Candidatus Methanoplasma sp.]|jgi:hypothetical protein|nr:hypothetical protein [Candidatus Methanoplasma sp.]